LAFSYAVIIIVLLATTPRGEMHSASYVFGSAGIVNQTGGWNTGIAFLFGLLSVQWTVCKNVHVFLNVFELGF
jgi:ABC-type Mn2+/Zn2+ transport system permease subunit